MLTKLMLGVSAALALLAGVILKTNSNGLVLVSAAPSYTNMESYTGVLVLPSGKALRLVQMAHKVGGHVFIATTAFEKEKVLWNDVRDPDTNLGLHFGSKSVEETVSSTCTSDKLYPIRFGRIYECSSLVKTGGGIEQVDEHMQANAVLHDPDGTYAGFCEEDKVISDKEKIHADMCYTGDKKWIRVLRIRSITPLSAV